MIDTISTTTNDTATAAVSPFISVIFPELLKSTYTGLNVPVNSELYDTTISAIATVVSGSRTSKYKN